MKAPYSGSTVTTSSPLTAPIAVSRLSAKPGAGVMPVRSAAHSSKDRIRSFMMFMSPNAGLAARIKPQTASFYLIYYILQEKRCQ